MTAEEIISMRLVNQLLINAQFSRPEEVVKWLVAMQAQEYAMAKWAIGLRLPGLRESDVEQAFNSGAILRTHLMRPTWHFVAPEDIRWLLKLTAPRVHTVNAYMYRQCDLDKKVLNRCNDHLSKFLQGGKHLTRNEIKALLAQKKIYAEGPRLSYIMMYAELEGIICSGPRKGKQFTYALLDERVTKVKSIHRDEALVQFTSRYFTSRGPASVRDFVSWSGLTVKDAKEAANQLSADFASETFNGQDYWFSTKSVSNNIVTPKPLKKHIAFLLPDYDEYGMSYKDRSVISPGSQVLKDNNVDTSAYQHWVILDGIVAGTWKKSIKDKKLHVETSVYRTLSKAEERTVQNAVWDYVTFHEQVIGNR